VVNLSLAPLLAVCLVACKLVVTVPEGGKVVSEDGFVCHSGDVCVIEVFDDSFDSTFTAMPAEGYTFTRWAVKRSSLCSYRTTPCHLSTEGFSGSDFLLDVLASDQEFRLEPIFVGYDLDYWRQVIGEIEAGSFSTADFLYAITPNVEGCDPGDLESGVNLRALEATNQTRALHKLPMVDHDRGQDIQVQETSLMQRANNYLNHSPDSGDKCYTANAEVGAASSLLGRRSELSDPAADIFGWTNDNENSSNLMEAENRRWILFPKLGYLAYGQVDGFAALKVFGFSALPRRRVPPDLEYVALPYRYYPYILVSQEPDPTPWSLSMVPRGIVVGSVDYFANAEVEVIEKDSGKSLPIRNLHVGSEALAPSNFISWMVDGWQYDVEYTVKVSKINVPGGGIKDIEYPVVVDRYNLFDVDHPLESSDSKNGNTMQGSFYKIADQDSYHLKLRGLTNVTGNSEFSDLAFFIRVYDRDKRLVKSSDESFEMDFLPGTYTIVISRCDQSGFCYGGYQGTMAYTVTFTSLE
jgi:hypothetical protein